MRIRKKFEENFFESKDLDIISEIMDFESTIDFITFWKKEDIKIKLFGN